MKTLVLVLLMASWAISSKAYSEADRTMPDRSTNDTSNFTQPLRLRSFTARILSANRIELNWLTAETWTNVTHYEIQRSYNSATFETVDVVAQTDNRPLDQYYKYIDGSLSNMQPVIYYRLKQVNRDGRVNYSFIVPVKRDEEESKQVCVWPVPVKKEINISFNSKQAGEVTVNVVDMTGRKVKTAPYQSAPGKNMIQIEETDGLTAGVYIVQVWSGTTVLGTAKFLKSR